jgi:hypothetical protein
MHAKTTAVPSLKVQALAAGLLVAFSAASYAAPSSGSSKTAQGIFVKMVTPVELAIEQNIQYKFDTSLAAPYFTNAWNGAAPTVQCTGGSPTLCDVNRPATAPAAPAPLAARVADAISANRCVWMDGGVLNPASYTHDRTEDRMGLRPDAGRRLRCRSRYQCPDCRRVGRGVEPVPCPGQILVQPGRIGWAEPRRQPGLYRYRSERPGGAGQQGRAELDVERDGHGHRKL